MADTAFLDYSEIRDAVAVARSDYGYIPVILVDRRVGGWQECKPMHVKQTLIASWELWIRQKGPFHYRDLKEGRWGSMELVNGRLMLYLHTRH